MDLRKYSGGRVDEKLLLSLWWYQPYIFSDDIVSGIAPTWFLPGCNKSIIKRSDCPKYFDRFWRLSNQAAQMYRNWFDVLCDTSGINLNQASLFEIACNTGYFLFLGRMRGIGYCVGIDKADLLLQRSILSDLTGIRDIDFREGRWLSESHSIEGLQSHETFDLVIATAFFQHVSDPLHLLRELSCRTRKALLLHTQIESYPRILQVGARLTQKAYLLNSLMRRRQTREMKITYFAEDHHKKWGDVFPNNFDTFVSKPLLLHSLKECGFRKIVEVPWSRDWPPRWWYRQFITLVCLK